jgi:hypothetical protein
VHTGIERRGDHIPRIAKQPGVAFDRGRKMTSSTGSTLIRCVNDIDTEMTQLHAQRVAETFYREFSGVIPTASDHLDCRGLLFAQVSVHGGPAPLRKTQPDLCDLSIHRKTEPASRPDQVYGRLRIGRVTDEGTR